MINASGTDPGKYAKGINEILNKVKGTKEKGSSGDEESKKDLQEYSGYYSSMPWWSELYISTWEGKLVALSLPSESPANSMTFFKHIKGDTFRRIRDNDKLGETLVFDRDQNGRIIRFQRHGNFSKKIKR